MMQVTFYDKQRVTYTSIGNVLIIRSGVVQVEGRRSKAWVVFLSDHSYRYFKKSDFDIERVEI